MASPRLEILKTMVAQNPKDGFTRFGLAMEYRGVGDLPAAASEFRALIEVNPGYAAAYYHYGQTLERLGCVEEARAAYREGIRVTSEKGDQHARSELQAALDLIS